MIHYFSFTYAACQSCMQRINCDCCENTLKEKLLALPQITEVSLQMVQKNLAVETSMTEDELCDALEELGVFL